MALMTRDDILQAQDIGHFDLDLSDVPGWGIVRIKDLTGAERDALEASLIQETTVSGSKGKPTVKREMKMDNVRATFCAACVVDENMSLLFTKRDITALGRKSARALDRIFAVIRERNAISDEDVEELVENFDNGQSGDSITG